MNVGWCSRSADASEHAPAWWCDVYSLWEVTPPKPWIAQGLDWIEWDRFRSTGRHKRRRRKPKERPTPAPSPHQHHRNHTTISDTFIQLLLTWLVWASLGMNWCQTWANRLIDCQQDRFYGRFGRRGDSQFTPSSQTEREKRRPPQREEWNNVDGYTKHAARGSRCFPAHLVPPWREKIRWVDWRESLCLTFVFSGPHCHRLHIIPHRTGPPYFLFSLPPSCLTVIRMVSLRQLVHLLRLVNKIKWFDQNARSCSSSIDYFHSIIRS